MNFRRLVRTIDTTDFYFQMLDPKKLKAQYNPERFHIWLGLHKGSKKDALNMLYSPHYRYLLNNNHKAYYQLQRKFGRNDKWIQNKIKKFLGVYDSIKRNGFLENVVILEKPIVKNKYNKSFEIYEGHHRVASALALGLEVIPCEVVRRR